MREGCASTSLDLNIGGCGTRLWMRGEFGCRIRKHLGRWPPVGFPKRAERRVAADHKDEEGLRPTPSSLHTHGKRPFVAAGPHACGNVVGATFIIDDEQFDDCMRSGDKAGQNVVTAKDRLFHVDAG